MNVTWPRLILFAVAAGVYTGIMALLPIARDTSFADISISFEVWVLFGILLIVNGKTPLDSALKCFVFFLISQPLVYLVQVPFSDRGWGFSPTTPRGSSGRCSRFPWASSATICAGKNGGAC